MQAPVRTTGQAGSGFRVRLPRGEGPAGTHRRKLDAGQQTCWKSQGVASKIYSATLNQVLVLQLPAFSQMTVIFCPQGSGSVVLREMGTGGSQMPQCGRPRQRKCPLSHS